MQEDISRIIHDGILAPSGENSQPWRFVVESNTIFIINLKNKDQTLYNSRQHGSYVAHGALIENLVISATHFGYEASVTYFPNRGLNPVAKLVLNKTNILQDALYEVIPKRCTNRNKYNPNPIPEEDKVMLVAEVDKMGINYLRIIDDPKKIEILAEITAKTEQLMFENKVFHTFFFERFFSKQQDQNLPSGLYIDNLGMNSFERFGSTIIRSWYVASFFRIFGIARFITFMRKKHYQKSASFGVIVTYGDEPLNYIQGGRSTQRMWLKSTALGISLQPCVGVLYLWEGVLQNAHAIFTNKEKKFIKEARNQILEIFEIQGETIPMLFRMGYGKPPAIKSFRQEPEIDTLS